ncbi:MAG: CvpA family protein [Bacteroidales bacterium]|nr:CvpA family protein [Bacteroidales bacterium]
MNALDLILIFPLIWAGFRGFKNGLITEVVSIAALVGGIYLALHYTDSIAQYIHNDAAQLIACALIFGGVLLGGYLGGLLAKKITAIPDLLDKILGIVLGVAKVLVLCSLLLIGLKAIDVKNVILTDKVTQNSLLYPYMEKSADFIISQQEKH